MARCVRISIAMDIARPDLKARKRRNQIVGFAVLLVVGAAATAAVLRLKPAAPTVERSTVWTDTIKRGPMVRQVRGLGTLVPREDSIRQIPAQSEGTVTRIIVLPGSRVHPDTIIVELGDPTLTQEALDAELQLKASEAELKNARVKLETELATQRSTAASVGADYSQAQRQAETDKSLYKLGVISGLTYRASQGKADALTTQNQMQGNVVTMNEKALESQMAVSQTKVDQARAIRDLKRQQLAALRVRAGIEGVLTDLPLAVGQRVEPGTMLAKVVEPDRLKAELKIAETQARDIQIGQPASVDTHNGIIEGTVTRIDPAVQNGTVAVDIQLNGHVEGERPDLSVDGTIDLERLADVLYVGRPAFGNENSTISLFRLEPDGSNALRTPVKVGRASVNAIQVLSGLKEGDTVILSDMSRWDSANRIRLD